MYNDIVLPNMGFGMEEGRLLAWLKKPGDVVRKGEPVAEVESHCFPDVGFSVVVGIFEIGRASCRERV